WIFHAHDPVVPKRAESVTYMETGSGCQVRLVDFHNLVPRLHKLFKATVRRGNEHPFFQKLGRVRVEEVLVQFRADALQVHITWDRSAAFSLDYVRFSKIDQVVYQLLVLDQDFRSQFSCRQNLPNVVVYADVRQVRMCSVELPDKSLQFREGRRVAPALKLSGRPELVRLSSGELCFEFSKRF